MRRAPRREAAWAGLRATRGTNQGSQKGLRRAVIPLFCDIDIGFCLLL